MLDTQLLRKGVDAVVACLKDRGYVLDMAGFAAFEAKCKATRTHTGELQACRNSLSRQIGVLRGKGEDASGVMAEVPGISGELKASAAQLDMVQAKLQDLILSIPDLPHESVPASRDETQDVEVRREGTSRTFGSPMRDHIDLGATLGLDFDADAKLSSARFTVLKGQVARLHHALAQLILDTHALEYGYTKAYVPYIVNAVLMRGTDQLPKFEENLFRIPRKMEHSAEEGDDGHVENFYLTPTVKVPLTNLVCNKIVAADTLPMMFAARSLCFRSGAGSYDKDTRGMIRQHRFDKVEMVQIVRPETSATALETTTNCAENILRKLELPFHTVVLCTNDMGSGNTKTYDIEVWIPVQNMYREIGSYSNMGDFQARRMQTRFRNVQDKPGLMHTLNDSSLVVGRTLVALLENYQNANGLVTVLTALRPYLGGQEVLKLAV